MEEKAGSAHQVIPEITVESSLSFLCIFNSLLCYFFMFSWSLRDFGHTFYLGGEHLRIVPDITLGWRRVSPESDFTMVAASRTGHFPLPPWVFSCCGAYQLESTTEFPPLQGL